MAGPLLCAGADGTWAPEEGTSRVTRLLCRALLVGYVLTIAVLTVRRDDLDARTQEISRLLEGPGSAVARLAFVGLAAAAALLAAEARRRWSRRLALALAIYGLGVLVAGLTAPDDVLHDVASLVAFVVIPCAVWLGPGSRRARWGWSALIVGSVLLWPLLGFGAGERVTVLLEIGWLLALTWWLPSSADDQPLAARR